ncbi:transmembrane protein 272-like [Xenopus laevis]|uniref:Transmembrane protein 272-like n=2 Tax=Xenopus laevis TaxID=8355 RepID=A0A1L8HJF6_XENLA|nr:transmembrane protein 272-like [Xenopus laevis]XP_041437142.1 transmembrane protein 272-like [Xenopus laevis]OCT96205.1 hypothetical protein XELAEV_18013880mg [Xenopus laevis]
MEEPDDSEVPYWAVGCVKFIHIAFHIANIAIGAVYIESCPGEDLIPFHLIIMGWGSLVLLFVTCVSTAYEREPPRRNWLVLCMQIAIMLVLSFFLISGNVWVYTLFPESWNSPECTNRCNTFLYLYAFWMTIVADISFSVLLVVLMCALLEKS